MHYQEIQPTSRLARYIECFWLLEGDAALRLQSPQRILPDGCIELVLHFADPFKRLRREGGWKVQPRQFLVGQMERHTLLEPTGRTEVLGIRFRPSGAYPFFNIPVREFTGRFLRLDEFAKPFAAEVEERLYEARTTARKIRRLEDILLRRLGHAPDSDKMIEAAVNRILRTNGCGSINGLSDHLGVSRRQLERKFALWVGLEPKFLCRILRFQRIFRALEQKDLEGWAAIAHACGYSDQAHFIKEFKAFSGQSPRAFFSDQNLWAHYFTRKNRVSHFYKTDS